MLGIGIKKHGLRQLSIAVFLLVLAGSAAACITIPQEAPQETAPSPPQLSDAGETGGSTTSHPPVITSFSVGPNSIYRGESVILSWDVSGATSVTIYPVIGSVGGSGAEQLWPTSTTTYTLTATNEAGDSTGSVGVAVTSADETVVGCDPVSGRNQEVDLTWEDICLSSQYQVQIAKDPAFTLIVFDSGVFAPASSTSPALIVPPGAPATSWVTRATPGMYAPLEAGHTYYWRARVRGDAWGGSIRSPWSYEPLTGEGNLRSFTIKAGLPATASYYGLQLLHPNNARMGCPVKPASFSWSPFKGTTRYKFVLARDAAFSDVVAEAEVATTAYDYSATLEYGASYFWRVMAVGPAPSDWSAVFTFQTEAAPLPPSPPEVPTPATPLWAWVVITVAAILVIVTTVLIFMIRRP
ncbi:MAG: fibronectin type III domain-containing protein [Dehalococcoidia bacterium]|nr:fibronectin type III domain-containing protein [Dehalococcoidia bacterium]